MSFKTLSDTTVLREPDDGPVLVQSNSWKENGPAHAFTTRRTNGDERRQIDMVSHPADDPEQIRRSREAVLSSPILPKNEIVRTGQVHGYQVHEVKASEVKNTDHPTPLVIDNVDGLLTRSKQPVLMGYSADCPLVFLYSDKGDGMAGILHVSWKGIRKHLIRTALDQIRSDMSLRGADVQAYIAPSIRACCYEVKEDFRGAMIGNQPFTAKFFENRDGRMYFDLQGAIRHQLKREGVPPEQIEDSQICNFCQSDLFYSYRRNGIQTGRMAGLISLAETGSSSV